MQMKETPMGCNMATPSCCAKRWRCAMATCHTHRGEPQGDTHKVHQKETPTRCEPAKPLCCAELDGDTPWRCATPTEGQPKETPSRCNKRRHPRGATKGDTQRGATCKPEQSGATPTGVDRRGHAPGQVEFLGHSAVGRHASGFTSGDAIMLRQRNNNKSV